MICEVVYVKRHKINIEVDSMQEADRIAEENRPEDFTIEDIKEIGRDDEVTKLLITKDGLKIIDLDYDGQVEAIQEAKVKRMMDRVDWDREKKTKT